MKSIKFYSEALTTQKVVNNILRVYNSANEDEKLEFWYKDAFDFCFNLAVSYNIRDKKKSEKMSLAQVCGIVAALSPLTSWERNKQLAVEFFDLLDVGRPNDLKCLGLSKEKALKIAALPKYHKTLVDQNLIFEVLNGRKICAFFENILHFKTSNKVTVDRHALSICLGFKLSTKQFESHSTTKNQYQFFSNCYLIAAKKLGISPLQVQSVTWVVWRDRSDSIQLKNLLKLK